MLAWLSGDVRSGWQEAFQKDAPDGKAELMKLELSSFKCAQDPLLRMGSQLLCDDCVPLWHSGLRLGSSCENALALDIVAEQLQRSVNGLNSQSQFSLTSGRLRSLWRLSRPRSCLCTCRCNNAGCRRGTTTRRTRASRFDGCAISTGSSGVSISNNRMAITLRSVFGLGG